MENLSLVDRLADPDLIKTMTSGEKVMASLQVTLLGMCITFMALLILWGLIFVMSKVLHTSQSKKEVEKVKISDQKQNSQRISEDSDEIIVVITAAIVEKLNISPRNIVIRDIIEVAD